MRLTIWAAPEERFMWRDGNLMSSSLKRWVWFLFKSKGLIIIIIITALKTVCRCQRRQHRFVYASSWSDESEVWGKRIHFSNIPPNEHFCSLKPFSDTNRWKSGHLPFSAIVRVCYAFATLCGALRNYESPTRSLWNRRVSGRRWGYKTKWKVNFSCKNGTCLSSI